MVEINTLIEPYYRKNFDQEWLQNLVTSVTKQLCPQQNIEIGIVITGPKKIRELNRRYRNQNKATDVLAFYMVPELSTNNFPIPPDDVNHLGEIIVSYPHAVNQARIANHSTKRELAILIIHGLLHLLGYDHQSNEDFAEMRLKEAEVFSNLGVID
jgi:probable rRNA maturation factor